MTTRRVLPTRDTHLSSVSRVFIGGASLQTWSPAMELTLVSSTTPGQGPATNHTVSMDSGAAQSPRRRLLSAKTLQGLRGHLPEPGAKGAISLWARLTLSCLVGPHRLFQLPENFCKNSTSDLELLNLFICGIPVVTRKSHRPLSRREPKAGAQPLSTVQGAKTMAVVHLKDVRSWHLLPRLRSRDSMCSQRAGPDRTLENGSQSPTEESKVSQTRRKRSWGSESDGCANHTDSPQTREDTAQGLGGRLLRCNGSVSFIRNSDLGSRHQNSSYSETRLWGSTWQELRPWARTLNSILRHELPCKRTQVLGTCAGWRGESEQRRMRGVRGWQGP